MCSQTKKYNLGLHFFTFHFSDMHTQRNLKGVKTFISKYNHNSIIKKYLNGLKSTLSIMVYKKINCHG